MTHMCARRRFDCNRKETENEAEGTIKVPRDVGLLLPIVLLPAKQLCQTREAAPSLHEFVGQKLFRVGTAADVDTETDAEERLEFLAQFLWLLQTRSAIGGNEVQRLERFLVQIRGLRFDHFNGHDS